MTIHPKNIGLALKKNIKKIDDDNLINIIDKGEDEEFGPY